MLIDEEKIKEIQLKILTWYKKNKRDLPWRSTTNPYYIHLSEIMLQQTQVERVKEYYLKFTQRYPNLNDLAQAKKTELLKLWQGLGYNNRIIRLQLCAIQLLENSQGKYPEDQEKLQKLPGIGPYTSGAILAFAYNKKAKVVDTNIRRILIHEFNLSEEIKQKDLEEIAYNITPENKAKDWNNALMDYGALELTARKTKIKSTSKQSKFIGSTRWVRSQILKQLLEQKTINVKELEIRFQEHNLKEILEKMQKDKLIEIKKDIITLA